MWVNNAVFVGLHVWVLVSSGAANRVMAVSAWWEDMCGVPMGRVHRSVVGSFPPVKITFPLYVMTTVCLLNVTLQPMLVSMRMQKRDAMVSSGMIFPLKNRGDRQCICGTYASMWLVACLPETLLEGLSWSACWSPEFRPWQTLGLPPSWQWCH